MHTHARTHTHAHTRTYARTHTHTITTTPTTTTTTTTIRALQRSEKARHCLGRVGVVTGVMAQLLGSWFRVRV